MPAGFPLDLGFSYKFDRILQVEDEVRCWKVLDVECIQFYLINNHKFIKNHTCPKHSLSKK